MTPLIKVELVYVTVQLLSVIRPFSVLFFEKTLSTSDFNTHKRCCELASTRTGEFQRKKEPWNNRDSQSSIIRCKKSRENYFFKRAVFNSALLMRRNILLRLQCYLMALLKSCVIRKKRRYISEKKYHLARCCLNQVLQHWIFSYPCTQQDFAHYNFHHLSA